MLTSILLNSVSSSANLLDTFVILHAAFIAAIHKIIGIEFGTHSFHLTKRIFLKEAHELAAYFVEQTVSSYESHWVALRAASSKSTNDQHTGDTQATSAGIGSKESSNLLVLLSELYNFQVVSCVLIYDLIRSLLNSEFSEHDVELLLKVVKSESMRELRRGMVLTGIVLDSGHQMRQDDPLALKDIIQLVQDKMRGKDPNELRYEHTLLGFAFSLIKKIPYVAHDSDSWLKH